MPTTDDALDASVLRQAAFGDVEVRHHLDARNNRKRQLERGRIHFIQGTIDTIADFEFGFEWFKMDIACPCGDRFIENQINVFDDRGRIRLSRYGIEIECFFGTLFDNQFLPALQLR